MFRVGWKRAGYVGVLGAIAALLAGCGGATPVDGKDACGGRCGELASCDEPSGQCFCEAMTFGDPELACVPHDDLCQAAEAEAGHGVCRHVLDDPEVWTTFSIGHSIEPGLRRGLKYLAPSGAAAELPLVFGDTNWYRFHYCLIAKGFPELFPQAEYEDYLRLVIDADTRDYYGGTLSELADDGTGVPKYVFTIETHDDEQLDAKQINSVYLQMRARFGLGELSYTPDSPVQQQWLESLGDVPFPVRVIEAGPEVAYEAYTTGLAYGRVRRLHADDLPATGPLPFGWQDVLVIDHAPTSLAASMAASVTGDRQDVLSHLNVLSSLRGTPNFHVVDALTVFEPYDGKLVRIEALANYYSVREASLEEAQAFWAEQRPHVEVGEPPDFAFVDVTGLDDVDVASPEARSLSISRYGSKATGVAVLRHVADPEHVVAGMGLAMGAYHAFMASNTWVAPVPGGGSETLSYQATIERWLTDEGFRTDPALRAEWLTLLGDEIVEQGVVDPAVLELVRDRARATFGSDTIMLRFRSSSNAEDSLAFNGAGLYASASGCPLDVDRDAPSSMCDPSDKGKPVDRAIKKVWASLWGQPAFEEREYYQMDHLQVGMGMLINPRFSGEAANGVAFTGNPTDITDPRFTINVQLGETPVVDGTPGVVAELDRVRIGADSVEIDRVQASSLVDKGEHVLSDGQLTELARLLASIEAVYPVDGTPPSGTKLMLDTEFKITPDGVVVLKQVRPFVARPYVPGGDQCR